jgi:DNA-binding transcriptional LysR family regulator
MERLNLNLLHIAFALYDERSVSQAARSLGMSQPAVSMALRKMRTTFNDPLFVRARGGVTPTPRAHALVKAARPLLRRLQEETRAERKFDAAHSTRPFAIALSDVGELVFLPRLLERLRELAPHCVIRSVSMPPQVLAREMEKGEVDLAIGYFPDLVQSSFFQQRLFTHHFTCLMRAGHPRFAPRLSLEAFLEMEHAVVHAEGRSQELFEAFLERRRVRRRIALHTPHFLSIPAIVARSDLMATVPHAVALYFARLSTRLAYAAPPFDIAGFHVKQHWHRKFHNDSRNKWLRRQVSELFNDQTDEWRSPDAGP